MGRRTWGVQSRSVYAQRGRAADTPPLLIGSADPSDHDLRPRPAVPWLIQPVARVCASIFGGRLRGGGGPGLRALSALRNDHRAPCLQGWWSGGRRQGMMGLGYTLNPLFCFPLSTPPVSPQEGPGGVSTKVRLLRYCPSLPLLRTSFPSRPHRPSRQESPFLPKDGSTSMGGKGGLRPRWFNQHGR